MVIKMLRVIMPIFACLIFIGACKTQSNSSPQTKEVLENMDTITVLHEAFDVELEDNDLIMYFPRDTVLAMLSHLIDTLDSERESNQTIEFNRRMIARYSAMISLIERDKHYRVINIKTSESLEGLNSYEQLILIEENPEIGFHSHFISFICMLAEKGMLSIMEKGVFVDKIYKKHRFVEGSGTGRSSVLYTTSSGRVICECGITFFQFK